MNEDTGNDIARRYPVSFGMRYATAEPIPRKGIAETVWMSGREVAFLAKGPASACDKVMLYIEWPVLLQGEAPLQLVVSGKIVQRSGPLSVAKIITHEFRTRGGQSSAIAARPQLPLSTWEPLPQAQLAVVSALGG